MAEPNMEISKVVSSRDTTSVSYYAGDEFLFTHKDTVVSAAENVGAVDPDVLPQESLIAARDNDEAWLERISYIIPGRIRGTGILAVGATLGAGSVEVSNDPWKGTLILISSLAAGYISEFSRLVYKAHNESVATILKSRLNIMNGIISARERAKTEAQDEPQPEQ